MSSANTVSNTDSSIDLARWDFTKIRRLNERCLRFINNQHSQHAKKIGVALTGLLRCYVDFDVTGVDEARWAGILRELHAPCVLFKVRASTTDQPVFVNVDPGLAFTMIDRLLGGSGESVVDPRELTPIERTILSKPIQKIVSLIASSWNESSPVTFSIDELISNPELVEIKGVDDVAVSVVNKVKIGNLEGNISFIYPLALFTPILTNLERASASQTLPKPERDRTEALLKQARVPIYIRFSPSMVNIEHLIGVRGGDVILLDSRVNDEVEVYVGDQNLWMGRPGIVDGRIGVKLTRSVKGGK